MIVYGNPRSHLHKFLLEIISLIFLHKKHYFFAFDFVIPVKTRAQENIPEKNWIKKCDI